MEQAGRTGAKTVAGTTTRSYLKQIPDYHLSQVKPADGRQAESLPPVLMYRYFVLQLSAVSGVHTSSPTVIGSGGVLPLVRSFRTYIAR